MSLTLGDYVYGPGPVVGTTGGRPPAALPTVAVPRDHVDLFGNSVPFDAKELGESIYSMGGDSYPVAAVVGPVKWDERTEAVTW